MNKKRTAIYIITAFVLGGFLAPVAANAAQRVFDPTAQVQPGGEAQYIRRFDDPDFQVKCWQYTNGGAGGLSCIPWSEAKERS